MLSELTAQHLSMRRKTEKYAYAAYYRTQKPLDATRQKYSSFMFCTISQQQK